MYVQEWLMTPGSRGDINDLSHLRVEKAVNVGIVVRSCSPSILVTNLLIRLKHRLMYGRH